MTERFDLPRLKRAMNARGREARKITRARKADAKRMYMRLLWTEMGLKTSLSLTRSLLTPLEQLRIEREFMKRTLAIPQLPDEDEGQ